MFTSGKGFRKMTSITCSICWSNFETEDLVNATKCGHVFHTDCLRQWWISSSDCPICRSQCNVCDTRVLYFSFDNVTIEDEFAVDLRHFKDDIENMLQDRDGQIVSLNKELGKERKDKKKLQTENEKSKRMIQKMKQQLQVEKEKQNKHKKILSDLRRDNKRLKTTNGELLKKAKVMEKPKKAPSEEKTTIKSASTPYTPSTNRTDCPSSSFPLNDGGLNGFRMICCIC